MEGTEMVRSSSDFWVKMKKDGLKTVVKLGSLQYYLKPAFNFSNMNINI